MFATSISKTMTAGILSVTLALGAVAPTTATAQMSDEDAIAGILALLFIGAAIHHSRDNDAAPAPAPVQTHRPNRNPPQTHRPNRHGDWRVLPLNCRRQFTRPNGNVVRLFTQRCLNQNYRFMSHLPQACHVTLRTAEGQRRQGFRAACLRNAGFRTNRH